MTTLEARKLIGKKVCWERTLDRHRGTYQICSGILEDVRGHNALIGGDWKWLPDLSGFRAVVELRT